MRRVYWSKWLLFQALLGVPIVVIPVLLKGTISLVLTIPIYLIAIAVMPIREAYQRRHSEKAALLVQLLAVVSELQKLTQGSHSASIWSIHGDLVANANFKAQMQSTGNSQASDLLLGICESLFSDVGHLYDRIEHLNGKSSDTELKEAIETLRQTIISYRRLTDSFLRLLKETKVKGKESEAVQDKAPFATRIHDDLADDYDRLMEDARRLGRDLMNIMGVGFLDEQHLTRFRRAPILRG